MRERGRLEEIEGGKGEGEEEKEAIMVVVF